MPHAPQIRVMVAALRRSDVVRMAQLVGGHWRAFAVLFLLVTFAALIAQTYLGDSTSPYGTCYAASGRTVPCEAIGR
jgi:hypothetical protein